MIGLEMLYNLFNCESEEMWEKYLFFIAASFGFKKILFGLTENREEGLKSAFLKSNYPPDWRVTYENSNFHLIDPTVSHALTSRLPLVWTSENFIGQKQKEFYEDASGLGLSSGITYPVHGANGEFGMLCFISDNMPEIRFDTLAALSLVRDFVFESSAQFTKKRNTLLIDRKLTIKELECLKWIMGGKSSWDISQILGCSEATINYHATNLRKKFNVRTRQQVVVKAIKEGIITPA